MLYGIVKVYNQMDGHKGEYYDSDGTNSRTNETSAARKTG
jgi:hypothetical protein